MVLRMPGSIWLVVLTRYSSMVPCSYPDPTTAQIRFRLGSELGWNPSLHYTYKQSTLLQDRILFFV